MASASDTSSPDRCAIARSLIQNASRYKRLLLAENRLLLKSCVTWAKIWVSWMPVDTAFYKAIKKAGGVCVAYIVTDDDRRFQAVHVDYRARHGRASFLATAEQPCRARSGGKV
jgi:hypothetical protein